MRIFTFFLSIILFSGCKVLDTTTKIDSTKNTNTSNICSLHQTKMDKYSTIAKYGLIRPDTLQFNKLEYPFARQPGLMGCTKRKGNRYFWVKSFVCNKCNQARKEKRKITAD